MSKDGQIKSRFSIDQLKAMLSEVGVVNFEVHEHVEQMDGRIDVTKSGLPQMILNEVILGENSYMYKAVILTSMVFFFKASR